MVTISAIQPYQVTLKDGTTATALPFFSASSVPPHLLSFLHNLLNDEILHGETYPMSDLFDLAGFTDYWFGHFNGVLLRGHHTDTTGVSIASLTAADLQKVCLGSFYIKPNYPGYSNHICNGAFLVNKAIRNQGVGKHLGQAFVKWAPLLGYTNSVFNLVYESNRASCRLWESLGFKRLGRIPRARYLKGAEEPVDAIIYGYDFLEAGRAHGLMPMGQHAAVTADDAVPEGHDARLWRTQYYLANRAYPPGVNVREKSCLRTSAASYRLVDGVLYKVGKIDGAETLKKVIIKFAEQFSIATAEHEAGHSGINKTTSAIAAKYHWGTIKDTVANVIEQCPQCSQNSRSKKRNSDAFTAYPTTVTAAPEELRRIRSRPSPTLPSPDSSPERTVVPPPGPGLLAYESERNMAVAFYGYHDMVVAGDVLLPDVHEKGRLMRSEGSDQVESQVVEVLRRANVEGDEDGRKRLMGGQVEQRYIY